MTKKELVEKLKERINDQEREALKDPESGLVIGKYNREIILGMLEEDFAANDAVDESRLTDLEDCLSSYLNQYMEQKEGHKWVIIASIYNAIVLEVPIHPIEVTKIKVSEDEKGKKTYTCDYKEETEDSVCNYCVCKKRPWDQ